LINRNFRVELDAKTIQVNSVTFNFDISESMRTRESARDSFLLAKTPELINQLMRHTQAHSIERIFDLGIFKGGSVALYNELFSPKQLVAIEHATEPVAALNDYIASRNLETVIRTYYGTDQADAGALRRICHENFGAAPLDLVVDDASHFYDQTKASFNALFPLLRPEGLYVIEDWAWNHWPGDHWKNPDGVFYGKRPLSDLVFEIVKTCASSLESLVKNITITGSVAYIQRGYATFDPEWDVSNAYLCHNETR
jgi:predicted O-methyltransferase YrrM